MFAVTAILSCIIKICGIFKSTEWRHFENVKFEALSARRVSEFGASLGKHENVNCSFQFCAKSHDACLTQIGSAVPKIVRNLNAC